MSIGESDEYQNLDIITKITSDDLSIIESTEQGNRGLISCWSHGTPLVHELNGSWGVKSKQLEN